MDHLPGHSRDVSHGHDLRSNENGHHDHETADPVVAPPACNAKPVNVPVRTSARVSKKVKLDLPLAVTQTKSTKKEEEDSKQNQAGTPDAKRRRRNWGLWSVEDKNIFFEALNEFGKDFDAIQAHFAVKMKKKGSAEAKNKDQVRHFYYRNWHKISKFIKFSVELHKATQELYALINFGELRKRMGRSVLDKNTVVKLHELIYHGFTLIKVRGKTVRVKTPLCRALRKLNQLDKDNADIPKLPPRVTVELRPLNNESWSIVHSVAQNPRARTSLPLQYRLSSFVTFLQHRWRHKDRRLLEKFVTNEELLLNVPREDKRLRLAPKAGCRISLPSVSVNENLTSTSLSLQTYEERFLGSSAEHIAGPSSKGRNNCAKGGRGKKKVENDAKKSAVKEQPEINESEDKAQSLDQIHLNTVQKILSLHFDGDDATDGDLGSSPLQVDTEEDVRNDLMAKKAKEAKLLEEQLARVRAGWTLEDANSLTVGELYVMFGIDGKLVLEYSWEPIPGIPKILPKSQEISSVAVASTNNTSIPKTPEKVASLLQKLVSLAKLLPLIKEKPNCPCGHVCNKSTGKSNTGRRSSKSARPSATASVITMEPHVVQAATVVVSNPLELSRGTTLSFQHGTAAAARYQGTIAQPLQDGVFRRPLLAPSQFKPHPNTTSAEEAFKAQLDQFRPKYCNRRGRSGRKNVVVQRMLPLLPKTTNGPSMLTLKMMPQAGEFRPIGSQSANARVLSFTSVPVMNSTPSLVLPVVQQQSLVSRAGPPSAKRPKSQPEVVSEKPHTVSAPPVPQVSAPQNLISPLVTPLSETNNNSPLLAPPSPPPSITSLLGLEPEELSLGADSTTLLDVPLATNPTNFVGLLSNDEHVIDDSVPDPCSLLQSSGNTPPISPTRILKETDNQWLNSEVADFSLSSFLGHLDSPLKNPPASGVPTSDDTRLSQDVEAQLQCLMSESSVDYMAKFADLAAQIASDTSAKK